MQIYTYSDSHATDVHSNGMLVGRKLDVAGLAVAAMEALNVKEDLLLLENKPLRVNYVGPVKVKFQFASDILRSGNEYVELRMHKAEVHGSNNAGFQDENSQVGKFICYFQELQNGRVYGCNIV